MIVTYEQAGNDNVTIRRSGAGAVLVPADDWQRSVRPTLQELGFEILHANDVDAIADAGVDDATEEYFAGEHLESDRHARCSRRLPGVVVVVPVPEGVVGNSDDELAVVDGDSACWPEPGAEGVRVELRLEPVECGAPGVLRFLARARQIFGRKRQRIRMTPVTVTGGPFTVTGVSVHRDPSHRDTPVTVIGVPRVKPIARLGARAPLDREPAQILELLQGAACRRSRQAGLACELGDLDLGELRAVVRRLDQAGV